MVGKRRVVGRGEWGIEWGGGEKERIEEVKESLLGEDHYEGEREI